MLKYICPECHDRSIDLEPFQCQTCGWSASYQQNIPVLINSKDKKSNTFNQYSSNYESICIDDMSHSIQDKSYLLSQSQKIAHYISDDWIQNKDVIEVGVGQGHLLKIMQNRNPTSYTAVDICLPYLVNIESIKINKLIANAENLPFEDCFDLFIATDILEHVLNVGDFLISMNRCVKMDGVVVIRVPFHENLIQYAKQLKCPYEFVHLRTFNKELLESMLQQAGFDCTRFHYDGYSHYNLRNPLFFKDFFKDQLKQYLLGKYKKDSNINQINNSLGNLLMRPQEICVIAKKTRNLT